MCQCLNSTKGDSERAAISDWYKCSHYLKEHVFRSLKKGDFLHFITTRGQYSSGPFCCNVSLTRILIITFNSYLDRDSLTS